MRHAVILFSVVCAACASTGASHTTASQYNVSTALSDFEAKKIATGQLISVSGYLAFGDDEHNVWESRQISEYIENTMPPPNDPSWKKCISLASYGRFRKALLRYNGKVVTVSGYISRQTLRKDEINLGSCNEISLSLDGNGARVLAR